VIALLVWAFVLWRKERTEISSYIGKMALGSFLFVLIEGALGAGLVLTGNTAETLTPARPFWMAAHLLNTLVLLTLLTVTAWSATTGRRLSLSGDRTHLKWILAAVALMFVVGVSGSVAALSSMIFPSGTITEGISKDFSPTSHLLLRLRPLHPILAVASAVFLVFWTGWLKRQFSDSRTVARWANVVAILIVVQVAFGAMTLLALGPILMQLGHLLLADLVWIALVLLSLNLLSEQTTADQSVNRQFAPASTIASSES
jgi:heme A synthase